ncbi:MAG: hypothetical protein H0U42_11210, partial [Thermoleophilaceae bacterium]|nr:hypothetical protein [Thermoleophilaceae bacterium]
MAARFTALVLTALLAVPTPALAAPPDRDPPDPPSPSITENISPAPRISNGRYFNRYPLSHYALDYHVEAVSADIGFGGVDVDASGTPALIAQFIAAQIWDVTRFMVNTVIELFTWAFSLDLLNGSKATGGEGALAPVADAIAALQANVLGRVWLTAAIIAAGLWGIWKAIVQRRYGESAAGLGLSVLFILIALFLVNQPQRTIGQASGWINDLSVALLAGTSQGTLANPSAAKTKIADELHRTLIHDPWVVLNFGGLEHCSGGKCTDNRPYARRYLAHPPNSPERSAEFDRLAGSAQTLDPTASLMPPNPLKALDAVKKAVAPEPEGEDPAAVAIQQRDGAFERVTVTLVIFIGDLGAVILIGFLSLAVLLAQVLALFLLAFAPLALIVGVFPGRGHELFRSWLSKLATALCIKALYSLIIAVVLMVSSALVASTASLGFLLSFGLQTTFLWAVFIYRRQISAQLIAASSGRRHEAPPISRPSTQPVGRTARTVSRVVRPIAAAGTFAKSHGTAKT